MKNIFDEMTKPRTETSFRETKRTSLYSKFSVPLGHDEDHRFAKPIHDCHSSVMVNSSFCLLSVINYFKVVDKERFYRA